jgi:hypothetical protein
MDAETTTGRPLLAGAADGAAATLAMSGVMFAAKRAGWLGEMPPRRISRIALGRRRGGALRDPANDVLGAAAHLAFGAAAGALFERSYRRRGRPGLGPLAGAAFGAAVWLVSYAGWVPALGLMPPPRRDRPGRPTAMIVAHLVYGTVLGSLADRRVPRRPPALEASPAAYSSTGNPDHGRSR